MRKAIIIIYSVLAALGLPYFLWLRTGHTGLACAYQTNFGIECPGCGTTAMFLNLAKFNFADAFVANPVVFILFFAWNIIAILCFWGRIKWVKNQYFLAVSSLATVAILILFGIIRNFIDIF